MSMVIEKLDGGYIVTHHSTRQIATAEHVARLIMKFLPDVMTHIRALIAEEAETEPTPPIAHP
jgi:hypothetical protein